MKKISFILYSLYVGGAERRAASLANYLVDRGLDVEIVLLDMAKVVFYVDPRIKIVYLNAGGEVDTDGNKANVDVMECSQPTFQSASKKFKMRFLKLFNPKEFAIQNKRLYLKNRYGDRIHQYVKANPDRTIISWMSYCNVSTMDAISHLPNEAYFVECTSPEAEFADDDPMHELKRRYYSRAKKAICQTYDEADYYDYLTGTEKIVIPNPIKGEYPERFEGERKKIIVNFCRLDNKKNIPLLIETFAMFHKEYPEYKLEIFGEGAMKERLIKYCEELGVQDCITFRKYAMNVHEIIRDYAMFVSSSDHEGISNSMLEALAIGMPTVCTDCMGGGAKMAIRDHENGLLVPIKDKEALCNAMKEIVESPELAEKLSKNAVKIKEELSMDVIGDKWYRALVSEGSNE